MKRTNFLKKLSGFLCLMFFTAQLAFSQGTVSGTITDDTGEPLIGANVLIQNTTDGNITDFDGNYNVTTTASFPLTMVVSFTGYTTQEITVNAPTNGLDVVMSQGILLGEDIIISASRRREKVQDAPASVSVLTARKLEATPNDNAARAIINEPGVFVQQQGAGRVNIQLRGDGGLFGSASFPILDNRSLSGPGLGTFDNLNSPLNNIDIERIEVVRGPASALYGPGVTSGVVHFISKKPIDHPGTTIELIGGELSTFGASLRHATKVSDKFGFKVNAVVKRGNEFVYDPNQEGEDGVIDAAQIALTQSQVRRPTIANGIVDVTSPGTILLDASDLDSDGDGNPIQDDWRQFVLTGTLEFRPQDDLSVILSGGTNSASAVFYNSQGVGLSQATEGWAQAQVQKGGFFAQTFWLTNNGGTDENPTFLYNTGNSTGIARTQFEAQVQQNFDTPSFLNANWTAGIDYRLSVADTNNEVYGRQEDDDDFGIIGGYVQTKLALADKLDLVVAGRVDRFNFLDETAFSPRAVFVYKPSPKHTFRAGFNRAVGAPSQLEVNIDFPVTTFNVPGVGAVGSAWLLGNSGQQTFGDNPEIVWNTVLQGLGVPNLPVGTPGLPNAIPYGLATQGLLPDLLPALVAGLTAQGVPADLAATTANNLAGFLGNPANFPGGFTGEFEGFNLFNGEPLGLIDAPAAALRTEDTWEIGYKGLIGDKLGVSLDLYNRSIDGATLFTGISPTYRLNNLNIAGDLVANIDGAGIQGFLANELAALGPDAAAALAAGLTPVILGGYQAAAAGAEAALLPALQGFGDAGVLAWTPTQELPQGIGPLYAAGYRTFEEFSYTGLDLGLNYFLTNDLSFFGNYSWTSDNVFNPQIQGVDGTEQTTIAQPTNRFRLGANLVPEYGWRANVAYQYDPSYEVFLGQFSGDTDVKSLIDAGVGYKWDNGLSLAVTAQNLFNNEYRAFPQFPQIGRRVLGTLTYTFGDGGAPDADGDGVPDRKDACPNIAGLEAFDGCPDSDGDGIIDSQDNCPTNAGSAANGGCPDSDGDGVLDKDDRCPNDAGTLNGCPDSDGDGVADRNDDCPNAAGTLRGCPDSDGDGVADRNDDCPNAAGTLRGCPDSDGDGVADKDDDCPTVAGDAANGCASDSDGDGVNDDVDACPNVAGDVNGCPDSDGDGVVDKDDKCPNIGGIVGPDGCAKKVPTAATEVFTRAIRGINFNSGSGVITKESYAILDEVAGIMNQYPNLNVSIEGHTDAQGNDAKNLQLSSNRAQAVQAYLMQKGISASRLRAVGYGETAPVADNATAAGRAQNRRVELKGSY